ncbi:alanine dehydrogenase [Microdochium nivale]|nr:alanine dehydrogenase [Microdochium nivale]
MSLTVLSDGQIQTLLESLDRDDTNAFKSGLKSALHAYSTGQQTGGEPSIDQPERTVTHSQGNGTTTLFMPSCAPSGHGVKVVTLSAANAGPSHPVVRPTGSLTLFSPEGEPVALLHAKTLTAFRTALSSTCLLEKRRTVKTLTVFGCGLQAYWHIRLALKVRGHTIRHVNVINRQFSDNAQHIMKKFYAIPSAVKHAEGWEATKFSILTPSFGDYHRIMAENVDNADVIYCCTPSTRELFDADILTNRESRKKGRLIVAIGSYTPAMRELPRDLLLRAVRTHEHGHRHFHKHAVEGGVVIVDTISGAMKEAGEIIDAGLNPRQLVELGELVMMNQIAREEEEEALAQASQSSDASSLVESFEGMELPSSTGSGSAMSSVYGTSDADAASKRSSSRSPSRTGSGSFVGSIGHALLHRRSSSRSADLKKQQQHDSGTTPTPVPVAVASEAENSKKKTGHESTSATKTTSGPGEKKQHDSHFVRWLHDGNVIYKSVGMGLMDLVVGQQVVSVARRNGFGTEIENFSSHPAATHVLSGPPAHAKTESS